MKKYKVILKIILLHLLSYFSFIMILTYAEN